MKLYYRPRACSQAPHIVLETLAGEGRLTYEAEEVSDDMLRSAAYREVNPRAQVPALVTDDGVLTESVAISIYLADRYGEGRLAPPPESFERAEMMMKMLFLATQGHPRFGLMIRPFRFTSHPEVHADLRQRAEEFLEGVLERLDGWLEGRAWLLGDAWSVADAYAFVHCGWGMRYGKTTKAYSNLLRHTRAMVALPAVRRVMDAQGVTLDLD